jgi:hypothetical protein
MLINLMVCLLTDNTPLGKIFSIILFLGFLSALVLLVDGFEDLLFHKRL